jgi:hypothetical protein
VTSTTGRFAVLAAGAFLVAGCGDDDVPRYPEAKACGVPVEKVVDVVGTDHFHTETKGGRLPLGSSPRFGCDVDVAGKPDVLSVTVRVGGPSSQAETQRSIDGADRQFQAADGPAGLRQDGDGFSAYWRCPGTSTTYITGSPEKQPGAEDLEALVTAVAEAAGCGG